MMLALRDDREELRFQSALNNDGSPLQVCVSFSTDGVAVRLVADPAAFVLDPVERFQKARATLRRFLTLTNVSANSAVFELVLRMTLPTDEVMLRGMTSGTLWLAVSLGVPALALYVNPRWGGSVEQWDRAELLIHALLPCSQPATEVIQYLRRYSMLAAIAVEGTNAADLRLKIYWRLRQPILLTRLGVPPLADAAVSEFLIMTLGEKAISRSGLVMSVGFSMATGILLDAKVDVCAHCISMPAASWIGLVNRCIDKNHLAPSHLGKVLMSGSAEVAMLGFAIDYGGKRRLNVYLKGTCARRPDP
jgi:hypothetical protein